MLTFKCGLCSKILNAIDDIVSTSCGHVFHGPCLKRRFNERDNCPACQQKYTNTTKLIFSFSSEPCCRAKDAVIKDLHSSLSKLEDRYNSLQDTNRKVRISWGKEVYEGKEKLEQLTLKNKELLDINRSNAVMETQIEVLKEKNKQILSELTEEVRRSSHLTTENLRLKSLLEQALLTPDPCSNGAHENVDKNLVTSKQICEKGAEITVGAHAKKLKNGVSMPGVVIRNVKEMFADCDAMKKYVFMIFETMEISNIKDNILDVSYLSGKKLNKRALVVSFKSSETKNVVLSNLDKLKAKFQHLTLHEYMADNSSIINLYRQATSLKSFGYKKVYLENNQVIVSKSKYSEEVMISSVADIEKLKKNASAAVDNATKTPTGNKTETKPGEFSGPKLPKQSEVATTSEPSEDVSEDDYDGNDDKDYYVVEKENGFEQYYYKEDGMWFECPCWLCKADVKYL